MPVYEVETDNGVYEVEVDEPQGSSDQPAGKPSALRRAVGAFAETLNPIEPFMSAVIPGYPMFQGMKAADRAVESARGGNYGAAAENIPLVGPFVHDVREGDAASFAGHAAGAGVSALLGRAATRLPSTPRAIPTPRVSRIPNIPPEIAAEAGAKAGGLIGDVLPFPMASTIGRAAGRMLGKKAAETLGARKPASAPPPIPEESPMPAPRRPIEPARNIEPPALLKRDPLKPEAVTGAEDMGLESQLQTSLDMIRGGIRPRPVIPKAQALETEGVRATTREMPRETRAEVPKSFYRAAKEGNADVSQATAVYKGTAQVNKGQNLGQLIYDTGTSPARAAKWTPERWASEAKAVGIPKPSQASIGEAVTYMKRLSKEGKQK